MGPVPRRQNPQRQPLTVALRKICRDYPAGAGVLRELLQNADDAGASTLKFVLDTKTHPDSPVLVPGLEVYQGPALLAYNDAVFSEKDFQSLSSLGDSMKIQQKVTTGKFGLGFSSVYNWTDCPSILSASTLLFQDPHHSWSRSFNPPGGPDYDFPSDAEDEAMANQLDCFSLINSEWHRPFNGTIIRIPLRNGPQAEKSEISDKKTSVDDVRRSMESFANEMGTDGLLFLRSVRRILVSVDDQKFDEVEIVNRSELDEPKKCLKNLLHGVMNPENEWSGEVYYETSLQHWTNTREPVSRTFAVLHFATESASNVSLTKWASSEKVFPWVAIAAPLTDDDDSVNPGRLYSVLPLPISTQLPVHIHGLFSISADRSRLHGLHERGVQDDQPDSWNRFLFDQMIPTAWAKLLVNVCRKYPRQDFFYLWPDKNSASNGWWRGMCRSVMDLVCRNNDAVWFTELGYIGINDGPLASLSIDFKQKRAFQEASLPVIYLTDYLLHEAQNMPAGRSLCPRTVFAHLSRTGNSKYLSSESKLVILDYLRWEFSLQDLATLEIFPFKDSTFRSLKSPPIFLPRDTLDEELFAREPEKSLDMERMSELTSTWLHEQVKDDVSTVRYRTSADLRDYFLHHVGNGSSDTLTIGQKERLWTSKVWEWLMRHYLDELPVSDVGPLWLVPLLDSVGRKVVPQHASNFATWFPPGRERNLALEIIALDPATGPKLVENDALGDMALDCLLSHAKKEKCLLLRIGTDLEDFLNFLQAGRILLSNAPAEIKDSVFRMVKEMYQRQQGNTLGRGKDALRSLCIFKEVQWPINATASSPMIRRWTDLTRNVPYIGIRTLVPLPSSLSQVFIDATDESECWLFGGLNLMPCCDEIQILENFVIPALQNGSYEQVASNYRAEVVDILFQNYFRLSTPAKTCVPTLSAVPLEKRQDDKITTFGRSIDLVDPQESVLIGLFFDDESNRPETQFYNRFPGVLADCGMMRKLNEPIILDRVNAFEKRKLSFDDVASRARILLQTPFHEAALSEGFLHSVRRGVWLPAHNIEGSCSLVSSGECRDKDEQALVGRVWDILPFIVHQSWRSILGWQGRVPAGVLLSQLGQSIGVSDIHSIERVLVYLAQYYEVDEYLERLMPSRFVQSSNGSLIMPAQACHQGAESLMPYLHNVGTSFWASHRRLLSRANVPEFPNLERLLSVQQALESKDVLTDADLNVAVETAQIWSSRPHESLEGLKVPDDAGGLRNVRSLIFNDAPWVSDARCAVAHPKLSRAVAQRLGMQPMSNLLRNSELGICDMDDDEFNQHEEVCDGIRDTLDRYTRESTFHEYLANADDCGSATTVNFLIDETSYDTGRLLTTDMSILQGPALLIHNDGVFKDSDWVGLKHVGRGSKRDDPNTIGKFGRGSQTMYHWTDVPMILSGSYLVILDPQQKQLPLNYSTKQRKPGVKIRYTKLKTSCPDQLAPFEGLWGFNSEKDHYSGTIFRFPLRSHGAKSELMESLRCPDLMTTVQILQGFLDEARLTILFLRHIESVDFSIRHQGKFDWRVSRGSWPAEGIFSDWADVLAESCSSQSAFSTSQRWWRAMVDVCDISTDLQHRHKRRMKNVECGIAAHIPSEKEAGRRPLSSPKSRFFNCVPLKFESSLPVQIHATFLLSGDRQNIATEETSQDAGSDWNKWLLTKKIPQVYLQFLEDLGRKIGSKVYDYFPTETSSDHQVLSKLVQTAFWEAISSSHRLLFPVVEASGAEIKPAHSVARQKTRRAPHLTGATQAVFDYLDKRRSQAFRPLLSNCAENLVCPPAVIKSRMQAVAHLTSVTPSFVRHILKSGKATQHVEQIVRTNPEAMSMLLSFIHPASDDDLIELDGCPILPLVDGGLGTISLIVNDNKAVDHHTFFLADARCRSLFSHASRRFAQDEGNTAFVRYIQQTGKFNLRRLEKRDAGLMLQYKKSWRIDSASKSWLYDFWDYMNSSPQSPEPAVEEDLKPLQHFPLLWCRLGETEMLQSLKAFQEDAAVLDSSIEADRKIYADFTDLGVVDCKTIPKSYWKTTTSLDHVDSMNRFLTSIGVLAKKNVQNVTDFVKPRLKDKHAERLRAVLKSFSSLSPSMVSEIAKELPIWPRISPARGRLAIKEALAACEPGLVVPWMKDYQHFIAATTYPGVQKLESAPLLENYVLPYLPVLLDEVGKPSYIRFVNTLSTKSPMAQSLSNKKNRKQASSHMLCSYRLAPRKDGILCLTSTLYDDRDAVFAAAFRSEASTRFLMPAVKLYSSLWDELGLRRRKNGQLAGPDYVECLEALQRRLAKSNDPDLRDDTKAVLHPLCVNDGTLESLDQTTWRAIRKLAVFPVMSAAEGERNYRTARTTELASRRRHMSIKDLVRREFAPICWSQAAFALHEPSTLSITQSGLKVQPSCGMVWEHLMYLAQCFPSIDEAEIEYFVGDLQKTYEFLHLNQHESQTTFSYQDADIWLNPEVTDCDLITSEILQSSWTSLENLILDSPCDTPPRTTVHSFLGRFSSLLKLLGCKSVHYPSITLPSDARPDTAMAAVRQLWDEGILNDVKFKAEGGVVSAHKVVLASRSRYCKTQFSGPWANTCESNMTSKVIELEDMTFAALKILIGYCYDEHLDWASELHVQDGESLPVIAEKLDALLDVLVAADRWLMPDLHLDAERHITAGIRYFVRPDNVEHVRKIADEANAEELRAYCLEYSLMNAEAIMLANVDEDA